MNAQKYSGIAFLIPIICLFGILFSCNGAGSEEKGRGDDTLVSGELVVFHAGSVSLPVRAIADSFQRLYPGVRILHEAAGSRECARKITDLKKPCDVFISADVEVISSLLYPDYVKGWIGFATNEMVIAYTPRSRYSEIIDSLNWPDILLKNDVIYGRSDPNADPCGYRTLLTLQLASEHYGRKGLHEKLTQKDQAFIRPKEMDLLALLESGNIDYIFIYRSVAQQHNLRILQLPAYVNLSNPVMEDVYARVSVELTGRKPGEKIRQKGSAMVYGITIPDNPPNFQAARAYLSYFLEKGGGLKVFENMGQPSLHPVLCVSPGGKELWIPCPQE